MNKAFLLIFQAAKVLRWKPKAQRSNLVLTVTHKFNSQNMIILLGKKLLFHLGNKNLYANSIKKRIKSKTTSLFHPTTPELISSTKCRESKWARPTTNTTKLQNQNTGQEKLKDKNKTFQFSYRSTMRKIIMKVKMIKNFRLKENQKKSSYDQMINQWNRKWLHSKIRLIVQILITEYLHKHLVRDGNQSVHSRMRKKSKK